MNTYQIAKKLSLQVQPRLVEVGEGATRGKRYQIGIQHKPGANGEAVEADGYRFEVITMEGHKIEKVHIVSIEQDESKD